MRRLMILSGVAVALLIAACSGAGSTDTNPPGRGPTSAAPTPGPAGPGSVPPSSAPAQAGIGDGTFKVGTDVQAGTYRTRTPSRNCYWERLSGFSGATSDIIANDNTDAPSVVAIRKSDAGFSSSSCAPWVTDLSAITTSRTTFGDGTYITKTDFEPGTYKSAGGTGCYWERLSGFGGTNDDILANDNVGGPTIVTIKATDAGFSSHSCGAWTRQP